LAATLVVAPVGGYAILMVLVRWGLRAREVAALTLDDVDSWPLPWPWTGHYRGQGNGSVGDTARPSSEEAPVLLASKSRLAYRKTSSF